MSQPRGIISFPKIVGCWLDKQNRRGQVVRSPQDIALTLASPVLPSSSIDRCGTRRGYGHVTLPGPDHVAGDLVSLAAESRDAR